MLKRLLIIAFLMSQTACGKVASWYAKGFEGKSTASGYIYDSRQYTVGNMQSELNKLIEDQEYKDRMLAEYEYMADRLGPAGAPQHAARKMLELLKK